MDLAPGESLQIAGSNGIGKSSLIRIIARLMPPYTGSIDSSGDIGLIDERPALEPALPLGDALAFWQRMDGPADNELTRLGLSELMDVPVRFLSTGQKKRAAFARLIGQAAPIWLLDEPLNGLDKQAVGLIESLASEHCKSGGICIVASHQPFKLPGMTRLELKDYTA